MLATQRRLDDALLQRIPVGRSRFRPEIGKAKPAPKFPPCVVVFAAPAAVGPGTGDIAQMPDELAGSGELVAHPRRQD
ncbi:MAG: hypothetical protein FAZ92_02291 [Accumulibacter sp.]|nr:MAG: hypothetical protein FAZ92_02291 [Accumulibacter sp.]